MADTGEWEVVSKSGKKGKSLPIVNGKLHHEKKKEIMQRVHHGAVLVDEFDEEPPSGKENLQPQSPKVNNAAKKKIDKKNTTPQQPRHLDEALARLSVAEMQSLLDVVMSRFIDSPLIWLKDLASYLNVRINPVRQPDPLFKDEEPSYPASRLSPKVKTLLLTTLARCSDTVLASFHKHCITSMVNEQIKGLSVAGYKLFIQILSIHRPHIGVVHLQSYCELRQSVQNQTPTCLSLLWAIGQSGIEDFNIGLKVWLQLMVPLIGLKHYSAYVVEYGSNIFSGGGGGGTDNCVDVLGVREFFTILDFMWCSSGSLPKQVQRQLFALYPKVKTTAFTSNPDKVLRNFFPSFLRRLSPDASSALKTELKTCLVQCLTQDYQCWQVWSQLYLKHLLQSAILLKHLGSEVSIVKQSMRVSETVHSSLIKLEESNRQLSHKADSIAGLREATDATDRLLSQLKQAKSGSRSSGSRFWTILVMLLVMGITWDIKSSGSFYESKLGWAIERAGLVPYVEMFGASVKKLTIQSYRWCIHNIPFYYSKGCDLAEPYLILIWGWMEGPVFYCWDSIKALVQYIPTLKENIETNLPHLSASVSYYGNLALEYLTIAAVAVKEFAAPYVSQVHHFFYTKVFVGSLAPEKLQQYVMETLHYINQSLLSLHFSLLGGIENKVNITENTS